MGLNSWHNWYPSFLWGDICWIAFDCFLSNSSMERLLLWYFKISQCIDIRWSSWFHYQQVSPWAPRVNIECYTFFQWEETSIRSTPRYHYENRLCFPLARIPGKHSIPLQTFYSQTPWSRIHAPLEPSISSHLWHSSNWRSCYHQRRSLPRSCFLQIIFSTLTLARRKR